MQAKETAKKMIADNPDAPFVVAQMEAGANSKALDAALKEYKSGSKNTAAILFSVDDDVGKILCLAQCPKVCVKETLPKGVKMK